MELAPDDVWMIGDNLVWDVEGPKKLGIFTIWNNFDKRGLPKDSKIVPDMIVSSIYELSKILKNK